MGIFKEITDYAQYPIYEAEVLVDVLDKWSVPNTLYRHLPSYFIAIKVPDAFPLGNSFSQCIDRCVSPSEFFRLFPPDEKKIFLYSPDAPNTQQLWYLNMHAATHTQKDHPAFKPVFDEALRNP